MPLSFHATKSGSMTAYRIEYLCYILQLDAEATSPDLSATHTMALTDTAVGPFDLADSIDSSTPRDFTCLGVIASASGHNDVEAIVKYYYHLSNGYSYDCARFQIQSNSLGQPQWFRIAPLSCRRLWECNDHNILAFEQQKERRHLHPTIEFPPLTMESCSKTVK